MNERGAPILATGLTGSNHDQLMDDSWKCGIVVIKVTKSATGSWLQHLFPALAGPKHTP